MELFFYFCFKIHHVYHNKRSVYLVVLSKRRKGSWSYDILSNFLVYGLVSQESVCLWRSIYLEIYIHINTPDTIEHVLVFSNTSTTFRQTGRFWLWRTFFKHISEQSFGLSSFSYYLQIHVTCMWLYKDDYTYIAGKYNPLNTKLLMEN